MVSAAALRPPVAEAAASRIVTAPMRARGDQHDRADQSGVCSLGDVDEAGDDYHRPTGLALAPARVA
jgi:hypothetical protein